MLQILEWLKGLVEFIVKLTKNELTRFVIFCAIVILIYRVVQLEKSSNQMRQEIKEDTRNSNNKYNVYKDSILSVLYFERFDRQTEKTNLLEEQVKQLKKLEENANRIKESNNKILRKRK